MRMYNKVKENNDIVTYEYLWSSYKKPFTGLVEINKKEKTAKIIKVAEGDHSPEYAEFYALKALSENNYPQSYTHTAP